MTSAIDVHHIIPIESAMSDREMEALAFNPSNLQSLCIPCHQKTHQEMGKNTKEKVIERANIHLQRWIERHEQRHGDPSTIDER